MSIFFHKSSDFFQTFTKSEFENQKSLQKQQEDVLMALEARTIDKINCGEQQPEVDHQYKGEQSNSGYDDEKFWRNTRSYISYQLQNKSNAGKYLEISILDDFKAENLEISINGNIAEIISVDNKIIKINLPSIENMLVKLSAKTKAPTPRFHQIRILK